MRLHYAAPRISGFLYVPAIYLLYTFIWCVIELYDVAQLILNSSPDIPFQIVSVYIWIVVVHLLLTAIACFLFFKKKRGTIAYMVFFLLVKTGLALITLTYNLPLVIVNSAICLILIAYFLSSPLPRRVFTRQ